MKPFRRGKTVNHHQLWFCLETRASEATGWLGTVSNVFRKTGRIRPLVVVSLAVVTLGLVIPSYGQNVVNCPSFATTGACGVGSGQVFNPIAGANPPSVSGSRILFIPTGTTHQGTAVNYTTKVNVQAFTANFTFVPNGQNVAFVLQNTNNTPGYQGTQFVAGAGCEAGFFQAFGEFPPPNNIFALELDSWSYLGSVQSFTYSSAQIYQAGQSPCNPNDSGPNYVLIDKISTSPVPLNSPASSQGTTTGDTYSVTLTYDGTNLTLNMYDVTAGGACPGASCFTNTWNVNIPSWVGADTAYVGMTGAPGETSIAPLYIGSFSYTVGTPTPQAATPTFSPAAGTYTGSQSVTLSDGTSGATIYYTTNGTTPTTSSTQYTGPITVSSTETLEAIAVATGDTNSAVASAAYTISSLPTVSTPTFSPGTGNYGYAQTVTLADATSGAIIYYTVDGTTPTPSSTQYTGPVTVSSTETLKAIAAAPGYTNSAVASATYTINHSLPTVSTPTFSPASGSYSSAQSVSLSDATSNATIYYTTNGTTPTTSSTEYSGPITVSSTETLEAMAVAPGDNNSAVASAAYTITATLPTASTPTFLPAAGAYSSAQSVVLSDATSGATIYYTTDGTTPTASSTKYTGPVTVSSTETLQAIAAATGYANSAVTSAAYTIAASLPTVPTPAFSPAAGTYNSAQSVSISDATSSATIYYTTNGTTPTASSTAYTGPITVSSTETLQAIAVATGDSAIASAAYTITAPQPNFLLAASLSSLTVNSGGQGAVTLTVTPENGFDSPVVLACSGLPVGATCSFDQATVTPSSGAVSTQLTIYTSTHSSALQPGSQTHLPLTALAMTVGLFGWRKRRGWRHWLLFVVAYAGLGLLFGCSGNSGAGGTTNTAASSGTSMVTVTAISGTLQGKATITLTVN
jgi:LysM repeat protein